MVEELKPCPFCGGEATPDYSAIDGEEAYHFHCQAKDCPSWPNVSGDTEAEAITAWNTRAGQSEADALRERVAELEQRLELTGDFSDGPDGIECRDGTIQLLDERVAFLRERVKVLEGALEAHEAHISNGQEIVVRYLVPAVDPRSIEANDFINRMIEHFDGPAQRKVQDLARQALERTDHDQ